MVLCVTQKWLFYDIAVKNLLKHLYFKECPQFLCTLILSSAMLWANQTPQKHFTTRKNKPQLILMSVSANALDTENETGG